MGLFKRLDNCNNSERSSNRFIKTNEAPYQMLGRRTLATTLGHKELNCGYFWISLLSECLSCYLYVFVVCSTRISWTGAIIGHDPNLIAMSLTSGIAMMLLMFTFRTVHVNPALTISFLLTGRIPVIRAILYILVQCMGAVAAIAFLYSISIKGHAGALGLDNPHEILNSWQILIVEIVISFVVTLATYATCNYSSYTCAKKLVLEQLSSNICDNTSALRHSSRRSVADFSNNHRAISHSQSNQTDDDNNYEYEYDNHRIYATQQLKSESSQVPVEEIMQDESQLLAPNGFSLHVTSGQAFVIGLAYTLTSLSGIPASGASLNPARSFGPAFIMNRWDRHWIYWLGPILGAVIAGLFYEFVFNPTRKSSLCYRPKLFRFSAQDMAKVGSKSRLYQQQQKIASVPPILPSSSTIYRPQNHHLTIQHSPSNRAASSNPISNASLLKSSRDPQLVTISTSVAHLQPSYPISNTFDQINYQNQQKHQQQMHMQANFDRSKSTAIINSLASKQSQVTINFPQRSRADLAMNIDHSPRSQLDQVHYDDPNGSALEQLHQFRTQQTNGNNNNNRRQAFISPNLQQQRFELGVNQAGNLQSLHPRKHLLSNNNDTMMMMNSSHKPFNTINHSKVRPHSMNFSAIDQASMNFQQRHQFHLNGRTENGNYMIESDDDNGQLDDDLYNVLSESHEPKRMDQNGGLQIQAGGSAELDYSNNINAETSDSSQRTSEMLPCGPNQFDNRNHNNQQQQLNSSTNNNPIPVLDVRPRKYDDENDYYNNE